MFDWQGKVWCVPEYTVELHKARTNTSDFKTGQDSNKSGQYWEYAQSPAYHQDLIICTQPSIILKVIVAIALQVIQGQTGYAQYGHGNLNNFLGRCVSTAQRFLGSSDTCW